MSVKRTKLSKREHSRMGDEDIAIGNDKFFIKWILARSDLSVD